MTAPQGVPQRPVTPRGHRKAHIGQVVSDRMSKTVVVRVTRLVRHPLYERVVKRYSSFKVHDETNTAKVGDWVTFAPCRPLSKEKRWRLVEVLRRASSAPPVPETELEDLRKGDERVAGRPSQPPSAATQVVG